MPARDQAATMPGIRVPPWASTTTAPAGTATSAPRAVILPPRTSSVPRSIGAPSIVTMRALVMASDRSWPGNHAHSASSASGNEHLLACSIT
jgi:hypothetical protein